MEWTGSIEREVLIGAVLLLAATLWALLCFSVATLGSWQKLARRYPAQTPPRGRLYLMESVHIGGTPYPFLVNVHVCLEGVFLDVVAPLRLGHPPIFIPATAMHHYRTPKTMFVRRSVFEIGWPCICTLRLRRKVLFEIEGFATGSGAVQN